MATLAATTNMALVDVCALLKQIERDNGRQANDKKFSPRTLDLDLLFYDDVICESPAQLPRDEITKNAFVLQPLAEVAPDFYHPVAKQTIIVNIVSVITDTMFIWANVFPFFSQA